MQKLANRWAGRLYGTNTGNLFFDLSQEGNNISGTVRINDNVMGVYVYTYEGTVNDEIVMVCTPAQEVDGLIQGNVTVKGYLTDSGHFKGDWESTIGTAGTFDAFPHNINKNEQNPSNNESTPEQIHNKSIELGSLRLFRSDVIQLIDFIKKDFTDGKAIVTYSLRGSEVTKYADDFLENFEGLEKINYLKVVIQEPEAYGINRVVVGCSL